MSVKIPGRKEIKSYKCGYLKQLCQKGFFSRRQWRRRFCVISNGIFYSYEDAESTDPSKAKSIFNLKDIERIAEDNSKKLKTSEQVFIITTSNLTGKDWEHYLFATPTKDEMLDWIQALTGLDMIGLQKGKPNEQTTVKSKSLEPKNEQPAATKRPLLKSSKSLGGADATLEVAKTETGGNPSAASLHVKTVTKRTHFSQKKCASEEHQLKLPSSIINDSDDPRRSRSPKSTDYDTVYEEVEKTPIHTPLASPMPTPNNNTTRVNKQINSYVDTFSQTDDGAFSTKSLLIRNENLTNKVIELEKKVEEIPILVDKVQQLSTDLESLREVVSLLVEKLFDPNPAIENQKPITDGLENRITQPVKLQTKIEGPPSCDEETHKSVSAKHSEIGSLPLERNQAIDNGLDSTVNETTIKYVDEDSKSLCEMRYSPSSEKTITNGLKDSDKTLGLQKNMFSINEETVEVNHTSSEVTDQQEVVVRPRFYPVSRQSSTPNLPLKRPSSEADYSIRRQHSLGIVPEEAMVNDGNSSRPQSRLIVDQTLPLSPSESLASLRYSAIRNSQKIGETLRSSETLLGSSSLQKTLNKLPPSDKFYQDIKYASTSSLIDN